MDAEFVSFAAVITHSHLCLSSKHSSVKFFSSFFHRTFGKPSTLFIKFISSEIESGLCLVSIFDVAMFSDVFYEINEKYYGNLTLVQLYQLN
jgi:hypothetical protein